MNRRTDNAPIGHTCPMINEVISAIESLVMPEDCWWTKEGVLEIMEKIRSANDQLRTWGNDLHDELSILENTKDKEITKLESDNSELLSRITTLENDIERLEEIVYPN